MATTSQNLTGGRLLLNVVTGGESPEQRAYGDFLDKDGRYARAGEFLEVVRRLWTGERVDYTGTHVRVDGARLTSLPDPVPAIYFGGSSAAAGEVAARHADVYLTWGEPPAAVAEKVRWIRGIPAPRHPRSPRGLRVMSTLAPFGLATNQDLDPLRLRAALGVFPTGVVAVATQVDGQFIGLAASSFTSVSLDPPLVSFSIAKTSTTWPTLRTAKHLGVTILADHRGEACRRLAGPVEARFDGVETSVSDDGAVTLLDGLAAFACTNDDEVAAGDHTIVLLRLHAVEHIDEQGPLMFHRSGFSALA